MDNKKEKLTLAKARNDHAFVEWKNWGMPEACDDLNDRNRELIVAYVQEYPNAKGFKVWTGIVDVDLENLHNFCFDIIFDGSEEAIKAINGESDALKKMEIADNANGIRLIWS